MAKKEHLRLTYLIRLWQVNSEGQTVWRVSLEDAHSDEKRAFGDLSGLIAFLQEKLDLKSDLPNDHNPPANSQSKN